MVPIYRYRENGVAIALIILLPILVKASLLLGVFDSNPVHLYAKLNPAVFKGVLAGRSSIDPNIGFTSHALGTLAAHLKLHGASIWWNSYEGIGTPLAGEMQSAALFPMTWLMSWSNGQLVEHISFQIMAGLATFAFLRGRGLARLSAWTGGALYSFNGTYAWLGNAVVNPILFLPVLMVGVDRQFSSDRQSQRSGAVWISVGLAGSIYAGFPEVAYLNGLLVAVWTAFRLLAFRKWLAPILSISFFVLCGMMIAAPILISFSSFLSHANLGIHTSSELTGAHTGLRYAVSQLGVPYYLGAIYDREQDFWGGAGGFAGIGLIALAGAGAVGRPDRAGRLVLAGWAIFCLGVTYGFPPFQAVMHLIPLTGLAALSRYLPPSWLFCLVVLASYAINDLKNSSTARQSLLIAVIIAGGLVSLLIAVSVSLGLWPQGLIALGSIILAATVWMIVASAGLVKKISPRVRAVVIALVIVAEQVVLFIIPTLAYPRSAPIDERGVRFLQANLGLQRFVTLGPIDANYGSYFGIAQVNHNDLPVSRAWVQYTRRQLDPRADPITFFPSQSSIVERQSAFEAIGTRYVLTSPSKSLLGLPLVYRDNIMHIYELHARPYFTASGCLIVPHSRVDVTLRCDAGAQLVRLEHYMPGWRATINGKPVAIRVVDEVFQAIDVPAGNARVAFVFEPPSIEWGKLILLAGLMAATTGVCLVGSRQDRHRKHSAVGIQ
jgi:hypothetical protein